MRATAFLLYSGRILSVNCVRMFPVLAIIEVATYAAALVMLVAGALRRHKVMALTGATYLAILAFQVIIYLLAHRVP